MGTRSVQCSPTDKSSRYGNRIRCISSGFGKEGGNPEGPPSKDGRPVVNRGAEAPHQLFGVDSRAAGSKIFYKGQDGHKSRTRQRHLIILKSWGKKLTPR